MTGKRCIYASSCGSYDSCSSGRNLGRGEYSQASQGAANGPALYGSHLNLAVQMI